MGESMIRNRPRRISRVRAGLTAMIVVIMAMATLGLTSGSASAGRVIPHSTRCSGKAVRICVYLYKFKPCGHCRREIRAQAYIKDRRGGRNYDVLVDQIILYRKYDHDGDHDKEFTPWRATNPTDRWHATSYTLKGGGSKYHGDYRAKVRVAWQTHASGHIHTKWKWSNIRYFGG